MDRRSCLRAGAALLPSVALAGCIGDDGGESGGTATTTAAATRDAGIYVQSFVENSHLVGITEAGEYGVALLYTVPHQFWTVTGGETTETSVGETDAMHLMAAVWDRETGVVVPETGLSVAVERGGDPVWEEVVYPMLSQRMGFHYGANFALDGDGTYDVTVSIGAPPVERTGGFEGRFADPESVTVQLEFSDRTRGDVSTRDLSQAGAPGAVEPMDASFPIGVAPAPPDLPGTVRTTGPDGRQLRSDGCDFAVTTLPAGNRFVDDAPYLAVSARSRYNDLIVPAMAIEYEQVRDGETVAAGSLDRRLDPTLRYHYGTALSTVESGDRLRLSVPTPPQTARHEGYERAMLAMDDVVVEL